MRLSELLARRVVDAEGNGIGTVADVVLVQDGPMLGPHAASFRVAGLIVVERAHSDLLGYEREVRPAPFRLVVRRRAGDVHNVPWDQVAEVGRDQVRLNVARDRLTSHARSLRT